MFNMWESYLHNPVLWIGLVIFTLIILVGLALIYHCEFNYQTKVGLAVLYGVFIFVGCICINSTLSDMYRSELRDKAFINKCNSLEGNIQRNSYSSDACWVNGSIKFFKP